MLMTAMLLETQVLSPSLTAFNAVEAAKPRTLLLNDVHMIGPATNMLSVFEGAPVPLIDEVHFSSCSADSPPCTLYHTLF